MDLYHTYLQDADVLRRIDAESVDSWMRAAAYAAGDDPEMVFSPRAAKAWLSAESPQVELDLAR